MGGWPESDNKTISVQLDLTWTGTGTELGNIILLLGTPDRQKFACLPQGPCEFRFFKGII